MLLNERLVAVGSISRRDENFVVLNRDLPSRRQVMCFKFRQIAAALQLITQAGPRPTQSFPWRSTHMAHIINLGGLGGIGAARHSPVSEFVKITISFGCP